MVWNTRKDIKDSEIVRAYKNGKLSLRATAKKFGCDRSVIKRVLRNKKVVERSLQDVRSGKISYRKASEVKPHKPTVRKSPKVLTPLEKEAAKRTGGLSDKEYKDWSDPKKANDMFDSL